MADHRFNIQLREMIAKQVLSLKDGLAMGSAEDLAQYKYICGQIAGLETAAEMSDEIKRLIFGEKG